MINVYHEKYGKCLKLWIDSTSWRTNLTSFLNPDVRHTTVKFCVWIYIFPRKRLRIICIAYSNFILYKPQRMLTKSENVKCRKMALFVNIAAGAALQNVVKWQNKSKKLNFSSKMHSARKYFSSLWSALWRHRTRLKNHVHG